MYFGVLIEECRFELAVAAGAILRSETESRCELDGLQFDQQHADDERDVIGNPMTFVCDLRDILMRFAVRADVMYGSDDLCFDPKDETLDTRHIVGRVDGDEAVGVLRLSDSFHVRCRWRCRQDIVSEQW